MRLVEFGGAVKVKHFARIVIYPIFKPPYVCAVTFVKSNPFG